jgi:large subunit ribosomal protein L22
MEIRATHRFARISPFKARDVARELKGLPASEALDLIRFTPKKAAYLVGKTLKSAIANAENNHDLSAENLIVKSATITEGSTSRRFNPRARGGAAPIRKRTAHINVILTDEVPEGTERKATAEEAASKKKAAKKKTAKPAGVEGEAVSAEATETRGGEGGSEAKE